MDKLFSGFTSFISPTLERREGRTKDARLNAARCSKQLKADRKDLEKREREALIQIRNLEKKGERYKAKILAKQIQQYRQIRDRNFEAETLLVTRAQAMVSNNCVSRAEAEAIKGVRYSNTEESVQTAHMRDMKYATLMEDYTDIETILNDGMDEIYDEAEESRQKYKFQNNEIESIMREAFTGKKECSYDRKFDGTKEKTIKLTFKKVPQDMGSISDVSTSRSVLRMSELDRGSSDSSSLPEPFVRPDRAAHIDSATSLSTTSLEGLPISINIENLDFSLDMLKRELIKNELAAEVLGIEVSKAGNLVTKSKSRIIIGKVVNIYSEDQPDDVFQRFVPYYDGASSLRQNGIKNGDVLYVQADQGKRPQISK